jgi:hypothetical protein
MCSEPGAQRLSFSVLQQMDGATPHQINDHGAVALAAAEGEVIDPYDSRRTVLLQRGFAQVAQQSVRANSQAEFSGESSARLTTDGEPDQFQRRIQPHGPSGVMVNYRGQSLAEAVAATLFKVSDPPAHRRVQKKF